MQIFKDTWFQMLIRLKLVWKDKVTALVLLISILCFWLGMADLNRGAGERANIPVGLAGFEGDAGAMALAGRLMQQPSLYIITGSYGELEQELLDGYIRCILVIQGDYRERIRKGDIKGLVSVYQEEGDNVAAVVTDIVAGEMMYDICLSRGYQVYEGLPAGEGEKYTREEYEAYAASLAGGEDFDFAFSFRFVDTAGEQKAKGAGNSLLYRQAVAAAAAMMFALLQFTMMSGVALEKVQGIARRRRLLAMGGFSQAAGNVAATGLPAMLVSAVFAACTCLGTGQEGIFIPVFWTSVLFSVIMGLAYYLWAKLARSLFSYQAGGAVFLLATGAAGFCSVAEGLLAGGFPAWFRLIPNCMYLKWFTHFLL